MHKNFTEYSGIHSKSLDDMQSTLGESGEVVDTSVEEARARLMRAFGATELHKLPSIKNHHPAAKDIGYLALFNPNET